MMIGIDLGTSSCKAGVVTPAGDVLGFGTAAYPTFRPCPEASEQDPEDWWTAACAAVRAAMSAAGAVPAAIRAVGLSGQIPTLVAADASGRALRPALTWQDTRGAEQMAALGRPDFGMTLPPSPAWPVARLQWLRAAEPHVAERAEHFLMAKDWVYLRLTGQRASDASSWRGLIHAGTHSLSPAVSSQVGWAAGRLPRMCMPTDCTGVLQSGAAAAIGLVPGIPVAVGWNDAWCSLLGSGAVEPGVGFDISGTSELAGIVLARVEERPGLISAPFFGGLQLLYGPTQAGGSSLSWFAQLHGVTEEVALQAAASSPPGSAGVLFMPYLQGERAPHWDPEARGAFVGLSRSTTRAHLARAVLEGVALCVRQLIGASGLDPSLILVSGGGARSEVWNQVRADVMNVPVVTLKVRETSLLGAAMLAAVGTGHYDSLGTAARAMVRRDRVFQPAGGNAPYEQMYKVFVRLYPALKEALGPVQNLRT